MDSLNRIAVAFAVAAALAWAMVAYSVAETATRPPETPPPQTVPEAAPPNFSGGSAEPLSRRLGRSGGIIKPPGGIDRGINQQPQGDGRTPVIKPPGTEGGELGVNPK